jgi:hypothetical protein
MSTHQSLARLGSIAALVGAAVLFASTLLHPMSRDPSNAPEAFAEYAADTFYVWTHLGQFAGFALLGAALVALAATFEPGRAAAWARIGLAGTVAGVAVAAALQAVDGIALKVTVDRWAAATGDVRAVVYEAALAVRQIEIGLAALLSVTTGLALDRFQFRDARQHALSLLGGGYRSARWPGDGGNRRRASLFRLFRLGDDDKHDGEFGSADLDHSRRDSHVAAGAAVGEQCRRAHIQLPWLNR